MIVNKYANGGGGSGSGSTDLSGYWNSAETQVHIDSAVTPVSEHLFDVEQVTASALTELHDGLLEVSARTVDMSGYWDSAATKDYVDGAVSGISLDGYYTSAQTEDAISAATSGKADAVSVTARISANDESYLPAWNQQGVITGDSGERIEAFQIGFNDFYIDAYRKFLGSGSMGMFYAPTTPGTAGDILVSTGNGAPVWSAVTMGGNSPIIPAITTQAEYEAISGSVKTGDLIEVQGVDINGDNNPEYGLFGAYVGEEEDGGVIRKVINWERRDSINDVTWSGEVYPWMVDNDANPIELGVDTFIISSDMTAEEEAYNGIGFDADGKPVITHIVPQYKEGEITGITRTDTPIGGGADMSAYYTSAQTDAAIAQAVSGLATEQYVQDALSGVNMDNYYTSAQTEEAISAATSGKADAVNIGIGTGLNFPSWNTQGIITGKYAQAYNPTSKINGKNKAFLDTNGNGPVNIYAPESAGTAGEILVSTGNGAPVWSAATQDMVTSTDVRHIVKLTQAAYDQLSVKDPETFYIIVSN